MSMQDDEVPPQMMGAPAGGMSGGLRMRARQVNSAEMDDEDDEGFVSQDVPTPQERRWSSWVAFMSGADMFMSLAILVVSWSFAYKDAGVSLWCMGLQAFSHFLSSAMLTFRFIGEARTGLHTDEASATRLLRKERRRWLLREQIVAITMGLVMLLSSAGLLFKAFRKIKFWKVWYKDSDRAVFYTRMFTLSVFVVRRCSKLAWVHFANIHVHFRNSRFCHMYTILISPKS